jgi:hypothetical protein
MPLSQNDLHWFAARLSIAVYDTNREWRRKRMSVEVKGLADIVREAKDAIRTASNAASGMRASAKELTSTVAQVVDMQRQLDSANADLKAAVGAMSNGGPGGPLDGPDNSSNSLTLDQAANVVADANNGVNK